MEIAAHLPRQDCHASAEDSLHLILLPCHRLFNRITCMLLGFLTLCIGLVQIRISLPTSLCNHRLANHDITLLNFKDVAEHVQCMFGGKNTLPYHRSQPEPQYMHSQKYAGGVVTPPRADCCALLLVRSLLLLHFLPLQEQYYRQSHLPTTSQKRRTTHLRVCRLLKIYSLKLIQKIL